LLISTAKMYGARTLSRLSVARGNNALREQIVG
jgi:hypothetical protein